MSDASKQHSERVITALSRWQNSLQGQGFASKDVDLVRGYVRSLEEQLEAARFALDGSHARGYRDGVREEQARSKEQYDESLREAAEYAYGWLAAGPERDRDVAAELKQALDGSNPASAPDELTDEEVEALGLDEIELPPASNP